MFIFQKKYYFFYIYIFNISSLKKSICYIYIIRKFIMKVRGNLQTYTNHAV